MEITVEYCVPRFEQLSAQLRQSFPNVKIEGNPKSPRTGAFEVTVNGKLIYSKLEAGRFPRPMDIVQKIEQL